MTTDISPMPDFSGLDLNKYVLKAVDDAGYENPTPIQQQIIPHVSAGRDVIGQAQTGTGKTAAFALPLLSQLNLHKQMPQVLVLTPTRELAVQVSEAFHQYASHLKDFNVLPIYGGQEYGGQLRRLKRGVHVVVGTPGRIMDHIRKGSLDLSELSSLVLDEADEMLRMGFIDDVEWILEQTPKDRQTALFSATMPKRVRQIALKYMREPVEITIKAKTATVEATRQRYWMVSGRNKLDALTRILEAEPFDAVLIFANTKIMTVQLAEKLAARGYACSAMNGDMVQKQREQRIEDLKNGKLNILIATDVAARGLDVERISHVINYDIPYDTEAYIHRIGRTGRAGRSGEAILFAAPREKRMLQSIEKAVKQKIELMQLPTTEVINDLRIAGFKQRITDTLAVEEIGEFYQIVEQYRQEHNVPAIEIAAALAKMVQGEEPFFLTAKPEKIKFEAADSGPRERDRKKRNKPGQVTEAGMERFKIQVGRSHGVKPANIVGAIANEAGIDSEYIGRIDIFDDFSTVDLPEGIPDDLMNYMKRVYISGRQINISRMQDTENTHLNKKSRRPKHKVSKRARTVSKRRSKHKS